MSKPSVLRQFHRRVSRKRNNTHPLVSKAMGEVELITEVGPNDVLFGRGSGPNSHDGNVRFRALVNQRKEEYLRTNHRQTKVKIAGEIVDIVLEAGGRFLKRASPADVAEKGIEEGQEVWIAVDHDTMMEKAKQALRQNLEKTGREDRHSSRRNSLTSSDAYDSPRMGMAPPRIVTPGIGGNPADPFEPNPMRNGGPVMQQQQQQFSSANIEAWTNYATAQVTSSGMGGTPPMPFSSTSTQQQQVMSELCGSMEISDLIQSIVNVRKDDYFSASDPQTKAMIAREIVDAALVESNRARQNLGNNGNHLNHPYEALLRQQNPSPSMPSGMTSHANNGFPQAQPTGGFNLYTMARGRTSSGQNQFPSNGMQPPQTNSSSVVDGHMDGVADVTLSSNYAFDRHHQKRSMDVAPKRVKEALPDGFNLIGGFPAAAAGKTKSRSSQKHRDSQPSDDQSMDTQLMLEQYLNSSLAPEDSSSSILDGPELVGMTDQDSIGTFNQSASGLESMAESSMMSFNSKPNAGGIDSFLSANAPKSRRLGGSKSSRKNPALKTHFLVEDKKGSKGRKGGASVMSSRSTKSNRSTKSSKSKNSVRDDMSIMSGVSNFSGMTNNTDHLSLMSGMSDLSEALNSLDLAGDYSQVLK